MMIRIRSLSYYLFLLTFLSGDLLLGQWDPTIYASFSVDEANGFEEVAASFTVNITHNPGTQIAYSGSYGSLNYTIDASGTAVQRVGNIGNYDFQLGNGTIEPAGATSKNVDLEIYDDNRFEGNETIVVTLSTANSGITPDPDGFTTFTYTIKNSEVAPKLRFASPTSDVAEGSTRNIYVEVDPAGGTEVGLTAVIDYYFQNGTT